MKYNAKMTHEEFDREACNVGLKTSAYIFFFVYGNAALNATFYGIVFKLLGIIDIPWLYVFSLFLVPTAILCALLVLHWMGSLLQLPMKLLGKLISREVLGEQENHPWK